MNRQRRVLGRLGLLAVLSGLMVLGVFVPAWAAEFRGGDTVVIEADEVIDDDLFVTAGRIEMNGTVRGDLLATGGEVFINGVVEGSVFTAGQTLEVNGEVGGSVYGGGFSLQLGEGASVGRNVYFGGFSLETESGSGLGRSLYMGGYQLIHDGEVARDLNFGGGALELDGAVGGNVNAQLSEPTDGPQPEFMPFFPGAVRPIEPGFRRGSGAEIGGRLQVEEVAPEPEARPSPLARFALRLARFAADRLGEFVALLIVGALLLFLWPKALERARSSAQDQLLPSAGWGCLVILVFLFAVPIAAVVILLLSLVGGLLTFGQLFQHILGLGGTGLALAVLAFVFVLALVTKAIVAYLGGQQILGRASPATLEARAGGFWALAVGALAYEILRVIPLLGWLLSIAVTLVGLGAIYLALSGMLRGESGSGSDAKSKE